MPDFTPLKIKTVAVPQMVTASVFYAIHRLLRLFVYSYNFTLISYHFADFLALIVCVPLFINIQILLDIREKYYVTLYDIGIYFLLFSVFFEFFGPFVLKMGTHDLVDILCYALGGLVLFVSQKHILRKIPVLRSIFYKKS